MYLFVLKSIKPLEGVLIYSDAFYPAQKSTIYTFLPLKLLTVLFITKLHRTRQPFAQSILQYIMNEKRWRDKNSSKSKTACPHAHIYIFDALQIMCATNQISVIFFPMQLKCHRAVPGSTVLKKPTLVSSEPLWTCQFASTYFLNNVMHEEVHS